MNDYKFKIGDEVIVVNDIPENQCFDKNEILIIDQNHRVPYCIRKSDNYRGAIGQKDLELATGATQRRYEIKK